MTKTSKPKDNQQIKFVVNGDSVTRFGYYIVQYDVFVQYGRDDKFYDRKDCKWEEQ